MKKSEKKFLTAAFGRQNAAFTTFHAAADGDTPRTCGRSPAWTCVKVRQTRGKSMEWNGMGWDGMEWVVILVLVLPVLEYILLLIPFHSIRDIDCFGRLVTTIRG